MVGTYQCFKKVLAIVKKTPKGEMRFVKKTRTPPKYRNLSWKIFTLLSEFYTTLPVLPVVGCRFLRGEHIQECVRPKRSRGLFLQTPMHKNLKSCHVHTLADDLPLIPGWGIDHGNSVYIDFWKPHIHKTAYTHFFLTKPHIHIPCVYRGQILSGDDLVKNPQKKINTFFKML